MPTCLVVGAGMAGLTAARRLQANGRRVRVVDKSLNPGGRMATRRHGTLAFDHGAQFFTARTPEFQRDVWQWLEHGWMAEWFGEPGRMRYRSTNGMNGLAAHLSDGLDVRLSITVGVILIEGAQWTALCTETEPLPAWPCCPP